LPGETQKGTKKCKDEAIKAARGKLIARSAILTKGLLKGYSLIC
jgi:hypothetical protein